jgi:hypothetical protein
MRRRRITTVDMVVATATGVSAVVPCVPAAGVLLFPAIAPVVCVTGAFPIARGLSISTLPNIDAEAVQHRLLLEWRGVMELCLMKEEQGPRLQEQGQWVL